MSMEATLATWKLSKHQLSATEKLFLLCCASRADEDHECWPSVKRMCEDTGLSRNALIEIRQRLIDKGFIKYTGEMRGRTGQVPVMRLTYVAVDKCSVEEINSTKTGTGTSTKTGTGTSTKTGTLNIKEESKRGRERKITLSESFQPSQEAITLAKERGVNLKDSLEVFKNYAKSKNRKETDWNIALINWIINEKNKIKPINEKMISTEIRSTVPFWEPGNPAYDALNGINK